MERKQPELVKVCRDYSVETLVIAKAILNYRLYLLSDLSICLKRSLCFACTKSVARSSNFKSLIARIVGVRALVGDDVFFEDIARLLSGLLIDKKFGVGPNGELGSNVEEVRAARYGRFQCINLPNPVSDGYIRRGRLFALHIMAELELLLLVSF